LEDIEELELKISDDLKQTMVKLNTANAIPIPVFVVFFFS